MTRAFWWCPICRAGSIGPKWFWLQPRYNLGSGHASISGIWITVCFTILIVNIFFANKQLILVFLFLFSVALAQNTTGITTATTMAAAGRNGPLAPHMRPCAPRQCFKWMDDNPPSLWMYLGEGDWGCVWPSKRSFVPAMMNHHTIGVFWGPYTPLAAPQIISACSGGCHPSIQRVGAERKASCGALGGHFRRRQLWLAMVVLVDVGSWRLMSDWPRIVKIIYGSIFFIPM